MTYIKVNTGPWQKPWGNKTQIIDTPAPVQSRETFAPKKAGTEKAHVVFVLDDSYSMQSCRLQTIEGFNEFLAGQKDTGVPTYISLYKFDGSRVNRLYNHVDVDKVPELNMDNYDPKGSTNLLDAIGAVMYEVNMRLVRGSHESVNIVILTDGQENSSREFDNSAIKSMVEKAEGAEWTFQFLGANIDAFSVGGALGFRQDSILQYSTDRMDTTFAAASRMSRDMTSMKAAGISANMAYMSAAYTDEERKDAT